MEKYNILEGAKRLFAPSLVMMASVVMSMVMWTGCKKELSITDQSTIIASSKAISLEDAQRWYDVQVGHLFPSKKSNTWLDGVSEVDWEIARVDTAANGRIEAVAPITEVSMAEGKVFAYNLIVAPDDLGNLMGEYLMAIFDEGKLENTWETFSGRALFFDLEGNYKRGYLYENGVVLHSLSFSRVNSGGSDEGHREGSSGNNQVLAEDCSEFITCIPIARYGSTQRGGNGSNETLDWCTTEIVCFGGTSAGSGGTGGSGGTSGGASGGGSSSGGGFPTTPPPTSPPPSNSGLTTIQEALVNTYMTNNSCQMSLIYIKQMITSSPFPTTLDGLNRALVNDKLRPYLNLSTAEMNYLYGNSKLVGQLIRTLYTGGLPQGFTEVLRVAALKEHLQLVMNNTIYRNSNISLNYPRFGGNLFRAIQRYSSNMDWQNNGGITIDNSVRTSLRNQLSNIINNFNAFPNTANQNIGAANILDFFEQNMGLPPDIANFDLIIREGSTLDNALADTQILPAYNTVKPHHTVIITFSPSHLNPNGTSWQGMTDLAIAKTFFHELIHGYYFARQAESLVGDNINMGVNIRLNAIYGTGVPSNLFASEQAQHITMQQNHQAKLQQAIKAYMIFRGTVMPPALFPNGVNDVNYNYDFYATAMSWSGLYDKTGIKTVFNSLYPDGPTRSTLMNIMFHEDRKLTPCSTP